MRLETTAGQLGNALRAFKGVIQRRNTIPVLSTLKISDGKISGTDLDTAVTLSLPSIGKMEGEALVDFFVLDSLTGHIERNENVVLSESEGYAALHFNGSDYRMPTMPVDDFPEFELVDGARTNTSNLGLVAAMRRVRFAISAEPTRYYLNGVSFVTDQDGQSHLVATNGHCLGIMPLDVLPEAAGGKILPRGLVDYMVRQKAEPEAAVFDPEKPRVRFEYPGMSLAAKTIDGTFPDVFRVIPQGAKPGFSVDRMAFLRTLKRVRAFAGTRRPAVKLCVEESKLTISCKGYDARTAEERVDLAGEAAAPWEAGYNADYLIQMCGALLGDVMTFATATDPGGSPALVTGDADALRLVIMPMRV